jgi:hypothetical protein
MTANGIYQMIARRGRQCGADMYTNRFRHHFGHTWLDRGGAEGDLMELNGWTSPQMLAVPLGQLDRAPADFGRASARPGHHQPAEVVVSRDAGLPGPDHGSEDSCHARSPSCRSSARRSRKR